MSRFALWFQTSIGAKLVMAVTGIFLFLFVVGHLLGNLLIFAGPEATNAYAQGLKNLGALLWVVRVGLLVVFLLHVGSALRLWRLNQAARPEAYGVTNAIEATMASRSIVLTGLVVLAFIVYHLLHFTLGVTNPEYLQYLDPKGRLDVYRMVLTGFSSAAVSGAYAVAVILLGVHLSHGVSSLFQTLGINHPGYNNFIKRLGSISAVLIAAGFLSIPLAVLSGLLKLP
ncbi:MAG: succinate dehydrogenase cytochrome b subunit [bacterium]|nr:succinate dehydrogenase cytochrome b subunit [bacterium]